MPQNSWCIQELPISYTLAVYLVVIASNMPEYTPGNVYTYIYILLKYDWHIYYWLEYIYWLVVHKGELLHTLGVFVARDYIHDESRGSQDYSFKCLLRDTIHISGKSIQFYERS